MAGCWARPSCQVVQRQRHATGTLPQFGSIDSLIVDGDGVGRYRGKRCARPMGSATHPNVQTDEQLARGTQVVAGQRSTPRTPAQSNVGSLEPRVVRRMAGASL